MRGQGSPSPPMLECPQGCECKASSRTQTLHEMGADAAVLWGWAAKEGCVGQLEGGRRNVVERRKVCEMERKRKMVGEQQRDRRTDRGRDRQGAKERDRGREWEREWERMPV